MDDKKLRELLNVRIANSFSRCGITTLGQLVSYIEHFEINTFGGLYFIFSGDGPNLYNIGKKSAQDILDMLDREGIDWRKFDRSIKYRKSLLPNKKSIMNNTIECHYKIRFSNIGEGKDEGEIIAVCNSGKSSIEHVYRMAMQWLIEECKMDPIIESIECVDMEGFIFSP